LLEGIREKGGRREGREGRGEKGEKGTRRREGEFAQKNISEITGKKFRTILRDRLPILLLSRELLGLRILHHLLHPLRERIGLGREREGGGGASFGEEEGLVELGEVLDDDPGRDPVDDEVVGEYEDAVFGGGELHEDQFEHAAWGL
jgi:hypothetical protein